MKIFSLIQLFTAFFAFGIYYYFIEYEINDNRWIKFLIFGLVWFSLSYFSKKFEGSFKFFDKRIDSQLSVWIVLGLIFIPFFIGILN
ncbi:hypothetical protein PB01_14590 [Psychrobacillus glaciei]|uniref:Uncharacterized protein n=1 Tax=Psychrobacillus glaciei TaxID=2283160 RepID=A0A5J6SPT2_9BACI|nr:hypothetical protein [Psychrobacillus glaciei]QFF99951.1 hypothetical protein PB01_14590 [Psychrobacillus glaciei]